MKQVMGNGKSKLYWNENASSRAKKPVGLLQMCCEKTAITSSHGAFMMYLEHTPWLNCILNFWQKIIFNCYWTAGLLQVDQEGGNAVEHFEAVDIGVMGNIASRTFELVVVNYSIAPKLSSRGCDKMIRTVHYGTILILHFLYKCQNEMFDVRALRKSSCKWPPVVLWYCWGTPKWKSLCGVRHGTTLRRLCILHCVCLLNFGRMQVAARQTWKGPWHISKVQEYYG